MSLAEWLEANAVKVDHLGPCLECGFPVHPGTEDLEYLSEGGVAVHLTCARALTYRLGRRP